MQILQGVENFQPAQKDVYLVLGNFDGVHKGHQELIRTAVKKAHEQNGVSAVLIYEPHPLYVLAPSKAPRLLLRKEQQAQIFEAMGLDYLIFTPFNLEIAQWSPEKFVQEVLLKALKVKEVIVGFNHSFGHKGAGNPAMMQKFGEQYGFDVTVIPPYILDGKIVSSTLVREYLLSGRVKEAREFLNYYPEFSGIVVDGEHRGRLLGFPTANIGIDPCYAIPGNGVYAAYITVRGETYKTVVNIGNKPTFHKDYPISIEAHILDGFSSDIYGEIVQLNFLEKIRDEKRFDGIELLISQINQDKETARKICEKTPYTGILL